MTSQIFHIGDTFVYYYSTSNYTMFCLGVDDRFADPLYWFEKSERNPYGITPDGKGWKLEFFGFPYDYIPTAIMLPN